MKKIVFVSGNGKLIERITAILNSRIDLDFQLLSTSRFETVVHDIEVFRAHAVIVDATYYEKEQTILDLCKLLRRVHTVRECFLLINGNDMSQHFADQAKRDKWIDDYIIYESSLESLFDRLKN